MNDDNAKLYISREKLWTERDAVEKLEALRGVVLVLQRQLNDMLKIVGALEGHMHMPDGTVVREISFPDTDRTGFYVPMGLRDKE